MDPNDVFVGVTAAVAGPVLLFCGFRALRLHRLIDNTPTVKVRSMAMGLVEVKGRIEERSRLTAPFSGGGYGLAIEFFTQTHPPARGAQHDGQIIRGLPACLMPGFVCC